MRSNTGVGSCPAVASHVLVYENAGPGGSDETYSGVFSDGWASVAPALLFLAGLLFFALMIGVWNPSPTMSRTAGRRTWALVPSMVLVSGILGAALSSRSASETLLMALGSALAISALLIHPDRRIRRPRLRRARVAEPLDRNLWLRSLLVAASIGVQALALVMS